MDKYLMARMSGQDCNISFSFCRMAFLEIKKGTNIDGWLDESAFIGKDPLYFHGI